MSDLQVGDLVVFKDDDLNGVEQVWEIKAFRMRTVEIRSGVICLFVFENEIRHASEMEIKTGRRI